MSRVHDSVKCHWTVTKQTNPLQMDNLIINKSMAILEVSRRTLNTHNVSKLMFLQMLKLLKTF